MALHTEGFRTQTLDFDSRGKDDGGMVVDDPVSGIGMAGFALDGRPERRCFVDDIRGRSVGADVILVSGSAVALGAARRYGAFFVPVREGLGGLIGVGRGRPEPLGVVGLGLNLGLFAGARARQEHREAEDDNQEGKKIWSFQHAFSLIRSNSSGNRRKARKYWLGNRCSRPAVPENSRSGSRPGRHSPRRNCIRGKL